MDKQMWLTDYIRADDPWCDEPSQTSQKTFIRELSGLTAQDTVSLRINSMGGSVKEAVGIYAVLKSCPARVVAYIDGFACSAASVIPMAADEIVMASNAIMMIHNASQGVWGNAAELRKAAEDLDKINSVVIRSYTDRTGDKLPEDKLVAMLDSETWLTAEECIAYGLVDRIGSAVPNTQMSKALDNAQATATGREAEAVAKAREILAANVNLGNTPDNMLANMLANFCKGE